MKVKNGLVIFFVAVIVLFSACSNPAGSSSDNNPPPVISTPESVPRYVASSYTGNNNDRIKYSYTYSGYDFYYIYLGELKSVPMFYQKAHYHGKGEKYIYEFSIEKIEEEEVRDTVSESVETTKSVTDEHTKSTTSSQKLGLELTTKGTASYFSLVKLEHEFKISGEFSWEQLTSDTFVNTYQKSNVFTTTLEKATKRTTSSRETYTRDLTDDPTGYYRFTYFTACDVYLYVIRDSETKKIISYDYKEYATNDDFWRLDYSETASFTKSDATSFEIDTSILNNLPDPKTDLNKKDTSAVTGMSVAPATAEVLKGATKQFSATVTGIGNPDKSVTWGVAEGTASTINTNGLLTVGKNETAKSLTVTATSTVNDTIKSSAIVTVISQSSYFIDFSENEVKEKATLIAGGDSDVNTVKGGTTTWTLTVALSLIDRNSSDGTYSSLLANYTYTVKEGKSNWTELQIKTSRKYPLNRGVIRINGTATETRTGTISGVEHDYISGGIYSSGIMRNIQVKIDSTSKDDSTGIGFKASLNVEFIE